MNLQIENEKVLTHIDLFSGIGGFSLASSWAGFKTVAFCENNEWCQGILKNH
jgi:DNA (cytosine-5)-methyltransferase 1